MTKIKNIEGLSMRDIQYELDHGAKFVVFQYAISILVMTFRRNSDIYFIKPGDSTFKPALGYTILSLALGWWGIPWGPIYTLASVFNNVSGGKNVTQSVVSTFPAQK